MFDVLLDFAGLADYEIDAGAPVLWPSYAKFELCRSVTGQDDSDLWLGNGGVVVRWGDPRINLIMEEWRIQVAMPLVKVWSPDRHGYHALHGAKVKLVFPNFIYELHCIPKMLGTLDTDSDQDPTPILSAEFDPDIYNRNQSLVVEVVPWGEEDWVAIERALLNPPDTICYVETEDHFFSVHQGAQIDRSIRPLTRKVVA
ncbi:MAG TPA: hypothetical protein VLE72_03545 [Candidatus Saccharimonadales bacterium]|nr:hypothetical protein [Candidatus Saccharimonadales bacterium]